MWATLTGYRVGDEFVHFVCPFAECLRPGKRSDSWQAMDAKGKEIQGSKQTYYQWNTSHVLKSDIMFNYGVATMMTK